MKAKTQEKKTAEQALGSKVSDVLVLSFVLFTCASSVTLLLNHNIDGAIARRCLANGTPWSRKSSDVKTFGNTHSS